MGKSTHPHTDPIGVALKHLGIIIRNEIPEKNVLPRPRREAELIGEVAQRDGGVRATVVTGYASGANPFPATPYFPY